METLDPLLPPIDGIRSMAITLEEPFEAMAARFAHEPGTVVLLSGGDLDCARYHLLAIHPWLTINGRRQATTVVIDGARQEILQDPLTVLETVLQRCRLPLEDAVPPVCAGLFGYLAYELKDCLERLPRTALDDLALPHLLFFAPTLIVVHDPKEDRTQLHAPVRRDVGAAAAKAAMADFMAALKRPSPSPGAFSGAATTMQSTFSRDAYESAVQRIRDYIAAGDVYQVNLSQRFEMGFSGDPYALFTTLFQMNPAPFFAYVNAGDHQVVSTSPERFLRQRGEHVETRPIKGTRPRGKTPEIDRQMRAELADSPKDDAELSMIVDLMRNDIGRVCCGGSVVVTQHKRLEAYQNVHHLVSVVEGNLMEGRRAVDLIRATFPGGSITGCPKIRCMEIIDELEPRQRHIYTGSIGYISFHETMDLSIAIRTATVVDGRIYFSVGGGIVIDSDPAEEYAETLHKGETLMRVFQGKNSPSLEPASMPWAWHNGRLVPQDAVMVPISDLGLQYGFGFFETLRVEKGEIFHLTAHLERFGRTWAALFDGPPPDLTWEAIISQVIVKNGLESTTAAVKLLATRGAAGVHRDAGALVVTARPYVHRLQALGQEGLHLITEPESRLSPLADHKTLNYLYYYQAGRRAQTRGGDEALILNPDGTVSETNTANLLVLRGNTLVRPRSPHVLTGVMQAAVCRRLAEAGFVIVDQPLQPEALFAADGVFLTNALMGTVPAFSLDGRPLKVDHHLFERLNLW